MTPALRWAAMRDILMFYLIVRDKVTSQCPQTTISEDWERRAEADSNRGPSAYLPNALPLGQTDSLECNIRHGGQLTSQTRSAYTIQFHSDATSVAPSQSPPHPPPSRGSFLPIFKGSSDRGLPVKQSKAGCCWLQLVASQGQHTNTVTLPFLWGAPVNWPVSSPLYLHGTVRFGFFV